MDSEDIFSKILYNNLASRFLLNLDVGAKHDEFCICPIGVPEWHGSGIQVGWDGKETVRCLCSMYDTKQKEEVHF